MSTSSPNDFNARIIEQFRANEEQVEEPVITCRCCSYTASARGRVPSMLNPVAYLADGNRYVIFASKAGAPTNPHWYHNLRAHPDVRIEVGTDTLKATAHEATGEERERLFAAMAQRSPNFTGVSATLSRLIPVIVLEPVS